MNGDVDNSAAPGERESQAVEGQTTGSPADSDSPTEPIAITTSPSPLILAKSADTAPPDNFAGAIGYLILLFLAQAIFGGIIAGPILANSGWRPGEPSIAVLVIADLVMLAMGWQLLVNHLPRSSILQWCRWPSSGHLLLVLALVLPSWIMNQQLAEWVLGGLNWYDVEPPLPAAGAAAAHHPSTFYFERTLIHIAEQPWVVMILVGCVLPGVCEEVFFRMFLGGGLTRRYGWGLGIVATSVLFGAFHFWPPQICYAIFMGLVIHAVFLLTRSIGAAMLLHALVNVATFGYTKLTLDGTLRFFNEHQSLPVSSSLWWTSALVSGAGLALLYRTRAPDPSSTVSAPSSAGGASDKAGMADESVSQGESVTDNSIDSTHTPVEASWPIAHVAVFALTLLLWCGTLWMSTQWWLALSHVNRGRDLADTNPAGAMDAVRVALLYDENLAAAYALRGYLHARAERDDAALQDARRAIELDANEAIAYRARFQVYYHREEWDDAIAAASKAIQLSPRDGWGYASRALTYFNLGRYELALNDCDAGRKVSPEFGDLWRVQALIQNARGEYRMAVDAATRALKLDDSLVDAFHIRANAQLELGDPEAALADLDSLLAVQTSDDEIRALRGRAYLKLARYAEAAAEFTHVIDNDPNSLPSLEGRAEAREQLGDAAGAAQDRQLAAELQAYVHALRGEQLAWNERFTEALEELAKCEALAPMLPQLFIVRARIRLARSELELALADCKQAIQLSPTEPMAWVLRGRYYLQTNERPLARQDFRQALRLDPENEEAASLLSLIDAGASELKQAP